MSQDDNGRPVDEIELGPVSIQWLAEPSLCAACGETVGSGPVGYSLSAPAGPRCDGCLLKEDEGLGMLMWVGLVSRQLAGQAAGATDPLEADRCMLILMSFSKMFDQGADWPHREAVALKLVDKLRERLARVPMADELFDLGSVPS